MELSRHAAPSRPSPVGLGFVVAVHLVVFWALATALVHNPPKQPAPPIQVKPIQEPDPPKTPEEPFKVDRPTLKPIDTPVVVPPPIIDIVTPAERPTITVQTGEEFPPSDTKPRVIGDPPPVAGTTAKKGEIERPGAICTVMPKPEVPAVSWSGEALMHVTATVRGGRVVATELQFTRSGIDSRTRRSLQHSVETALAGYQCPGDHVFEQDFAFKLE